MEMRYNSHFSSRAVTTRLPGSIQIRVVQPEASDGTVPLRRLQHLALRRPQQPARGAARAEVYSGVIQFSGTPLVSSAGSGDIFYESRLLT